ncbi:Uma2 family endonuclease [Archangium gephyra]|uniref:ATP synthase F0 sector subunit b n=2 Tax=Archangium gephyra TaxID=48 RepID=A0AAC8Q207_9BACT|nr:ATP synthase F0 sector subunit b [Archangium gephyra]REG28073.1 Uma2 family endonuclease [Archangium gephyra]
MSEVERARVVEELPGEVTWDEMAMPEGDLHSQAKMGALQALKEYFSRQRRRVYVGSELPVYYPAERRFAPDLVVVLDAEAHPRGKWVVSHEGKGLDWVLEVHVGGDRKKDAEYNVERYARVGIPEYFIYDRARQRLYGYRLPSPEAREYVPIVSEGGRYSSEVLGLELQVEEGRLRFWAGSALLLEYEELIERMRETVKGLQQRADEEARQLEKAERSRQEAERSRQEAEQRLAEETRRREELERRLAESQAELERLRQRGP